MSVETSDQNTIQKDILDTCLKRKQTTPQDSLWGLSNRKWSLFESPMVYECRALTSGSTVVNNSVPLYISAYGFRRSLYIRFIDGECAKKCVTQTAVLRILNILRRDHKMMSVVDGRVVVATPFKFASCGHKHFLKLKVTGSGPHASEIVKVLKDNIELKTLFTPEVHDSTISGFTRFFVDKDVPPMSKLQVTDLTCVNNIAPKETHSEIGVYYKSLVCVYGRKKLTVGLKGRTLCLKSYLKLFSSTVLEENYCNLDEMYVYYDDDTEVFPTKWSDMTTSDINDELTKSSELDNNTNKNIDHEERRRVNNICQFILKTKAYAVLTSLKMSKGYSFSWELDVKNTYIRPIFGQVTKGADSAEMERLVSNACQNMNVRVHTVVNSSLVNAVIVRLKEIAYHFTSKCKETWRDVVLKNELHAEQNEREEKCENTVYQIGRNLECVCFDIETKYVPHAPVHSECEQIISVAVVKFNHELTTEGRYTFQEYINFVVKPPAYEERSVENEQKSVQSIVSNIAHHLQGKNNHEGKEVSPFLQSFDFNMLPGKTFHVRYYETERECLAGVIKYMRTATVVLGFNSNCFDLPVLENRYIVCCELEKQYMQKNKKGMYRLNGQWNLNLSHRQDSRSKIHYVLNEEEQNKVCNRREERMKDMVCHSEQEEFSFSSTGSSIGASSRSRSSCSILPYLLNQTSTSCSTTTANSYDKTDDEDHDDNHIDGDSDNSQGGPEERSEKSTKVGLNNVFKNIKYISSNTTIYVDVMKLVARSASKMCDLNSSAERELGVRKMEDKRVQYKNLAKTYMSGSLDVIIEYNMLDTILTALEFIKVESMNFICCVTYKTGLLPRTVYEDGTVALITAVLARGTWFTKTLMPDLSGGKDEKKVMEEKSHKFDLFRDFEKLKYAGGTNGATQGFHLVPTVTVDATNMYPREIIKWNLGMGSMLTMNYIRRKRLVAGKDFRVAKLRSLLTTENRIVERTYAWSLPNLFTSYESNSCNHLLDKRIKYKDMMEGELDRYKYANYDRMQKTFKLILNKIYGYTGLTWSPVGALVTQMGRQATYRVAHLWKQQTGHNIANADTDSNFLMMCDEKSFQSIGMFAEGLGLHHMSSSRLMMEASMKRTMTFLDDANKNQEPAKFLFEKLFLGGTLCQGPKNYCGPKAEPTGKENTPYKLSFHVAGLPGGKSDKSDLKQRFQYMLMHLMWERDVEGVLLFAKTVYGAAFVTILAEEVINEGEKELCMAAECAKKATSGREGHDIAQRALLKVKEFYEKRNEMRRNICQGMASFPLHMVTGKEKVGDMEKAVTAACKAAKVYCISNGLTVDQAPTQIEVTRSLNAQVKNVLCKFLETMLVDEESEQQKNKSRHRGDRKLCSSDLTKMPSSIVGGKKYRVKFTREDVEGAVSLLKYVDKTTKDMSKVMRSAERVGGARQLVSQMGRKQTSYNPYNVECFSDVFDRDVNMHMCEKRKTEQDEIAKRAMTFMFNFNKTRESFPLRCLASHSHCVTHVGHLQRLTIAELKNKCGGMGIFRKGRHLVYNIKLSGNSQRTYDLWGIFCSSKETINTRYVCVIPKDQLLLFSDTCNEKDDVIEFLPSHHHYTDEKVFVQKVGEEQEMCKERSVVLDMHKYRAQTRSTPFVVDDVQGNTLVVNLSSFIPNRRNTFSFSVPSCTIQQLLAMIKNHIYSFPCEKRSHYLMHMVPIQGDNRVIVNIVQRIRREIEKSHMSIRDIPHIEDLSSQSGKYIEESLVSQIQSCVRMDDGGQSLHCLLDKCSVIRDDGRNQSSFVHSHKGTVCFAKEFLDTVNRLLSSSATGNRSNISIVNDDTSFEMTVHKCEKTFTKISRAERGGVVVRLTHVEGNRDINAHGTIDFHTNTKWKRKRTKDDNTYNKKVKTTLNVDTDYSFSPFSVLSHS